MTKFKKGDLIYYNLDSERCYGIVEEIVGEKVWAYWQVHLGGKRSKKEFKTYTCWMSIGKCTLESDWSKIKGFKNIPKIANCPPHINNHAGQCQCMHCVPVTKKKPRIWTVDTTVKSDDGIEISPDNVKIVLNREKCMPTIWNFTPKDVKELYKKLGASLKIHKRYFN